MCSLKSNSCRDRAGVEEDAVGPELGAEPVVDAACHLLGVGSAVGDEDLARSRVAPRLAAQRVLGGQQELLPVPDRLRPLPGSHRQAPIDRAQEVGAKIDPLDPLGGRYVGVLEHARGCLRRRRPGDGKVNGCCDRVDVGPGPLRARVVRIHFGCRVEVGDQADGRGRCRCDRSRRAKIEELGGQPGTRQHDVAGTDVAVKVLGRVNRVECRQQRNQELVDLTLRWPAVVGAQPGLELDAVHVLESQIGGSKRIEDLMHVDDVGMVELGQRLAFAPEGGPVEVEHLGVRERARSYRQVLPACGELRGKKLLERDVPVEGLVVGLIGDAEPALPERALDAVLIEELVAVR